MKNYIPLALILLPLTVSAQKKSSRGPSWMKETDFKSALDESGYHLQKAASDNSTAMMFTIIGGGIGAVAASNKNIDPAAGVVIIGMSAIVGFAFHVAANGEIRKAGSAMRKGHSVAFSGNGIRIRF